MSISKITFEYNRHTHKTKIKYLSIKKYFIAITGYESYYTSASRLLKKVLVYQYFYLG